ncbi:hypothetical protein NDU88_009997 [Pleurodeles waltl]|uniref:Uncharacterized protein n=1 Tax=Pleurodeles waltl TaxID=8319 RepID=A0AAV7QW46_PLEWA|nr:hypothetical protein NDU88_009997 [Pleurodeles waltl]
MLCTRASAAPVTSAAKGRAGEWRGERPLPPFLVSPPRSGGEPALAPLAYLANALLFCSCGAWSAAWSGRGLLQER